MLRESIAGAAVAALLLTFPATTAIADETVIATVNGVTVTQKDLDFAASEIGPQLSTVPGEQRKQVLADYVIENTLLALAAKKDKLGDASGFDDRLSYYRQRALRDAYFEKTVIKSVTEADAKKVYDQQIGGQAPQEEFRARHILVKTEADANDVVEQLNRGADFAELAKTKSTGPSNARGGDLGYFSKGQMVKPFEDAVLKLEKGAVSEPVKTQFGWHVIKLEDKRQRELPKFGPLKERIMSSLIQQKAAEVLSGLRQSATIEFADKELEKQIEQARRGSFSGGEQQ
ncbi:MAG: peptidylprolyl isomerase [Pseudomonadota bacterium]